MADYQLKRFAVTNAAGLIELTGLLHDEAFEVAEVAFESKLGVATIPLRRIFHGGPERVVRKTLFCRKREVEVLRALIRIKNVKDVKTIDTEKIGTYTFVEVAFEAAASQLIFKACPKLELRFTVSSMEIEYLEIQFAGKAVITDGLFWQKSQFVPA
ncbi:MAG: hypothetical protein WCH99_07065 [Verrucomicrobiota bacterium]